MILGSGNPTPYDLPAIGTLVLLGLILLTGTLLGPRWTSDAATLTRWSAAILSLLAFSLVHVLTPTPNGFVGAGRMITLWPAFGINVLLFAIWTWRVS